MASSYVKKTEATKSSAHGTLTDDSLPNKDVDDVEGLGSEESSIGKSEEGSYDETVRTDPAAVFQDLEAFSHAALTHPEWFTTGIASKSDSNE